MVEGAGAFVVVGEAVFDGVFAGEGGEAGAGVDGAVDVVASEVVGCVSFFSPVFSPVFSPAWVVGPSLLWSGLHFVGVVRHVPAAAFEHDSR